jgi:myosin-5
VHQSNVCSVLLDCVVLMHGVQVGRSKVFFRKGAYESLEAARSTLIRRAATQLQAFGRMVIECCAYHRARAALLVLQCSGRSYVARGTVSGSWRTTATRPHDK